MDAYLKKFLSEEFAIRTSFAGTTQALRELILRSPEFKDARIALASGAIQEVSISRFAGELMKDFRQGERFPHETALTAIAVLLEGYSSPFAEEFLIDLARVRLAEMAGAVRMARECLKHVKDNAPDVKVVRFPTVSLQAGTFSFKGEAAWIVVLERPTSTHPEEGAIWIQGERYATA